MTFPEKAAQNYSVAKSAYDSAKYDAAANRIYYAFYQACIVALYKSEKTLEQFNVALARQQKDAGQEGQWPHKIVSSSRCTKLLGLSEKQQAKVEQARAMREKGDYNEIDHVQQYELEDIFFDAPNILTDLGVILL